ncbi:MAG TPA: lysoplasmalogenase [Acidimicrobiales bacterium]
MTAPAAALLVASAVAAIVDWVAVARRRAPLEYVAKPLTLALLVAAALALDPEDPTVRAWFVAALVLSLAGDVFLMLPRDLFVPGLGAFLLAHVAYVVGLTAAGLTGAGLLAGLVLAAALLAAIGRRLVTGLRGREPALAVPVVAYMVVISAMLVCAWGTGDPAAAAGALLFYASDGLIGWRRFVAERTAGLDVAIIVTYHLGQALLVLSLV